MSMLLLWETLGDLGSNDLVDVIFFLHVETDKSNYISQICVF